MAAKAKARLKKSDAEDEQKKKDDEDKAEKSDVVDTAGSSSDDEKDKDKDKDKDALDKAEDDDLDDDAEDDGDEDDSDEDAGEVRLRIGSDGAIRLVMDGEDVDFDDDDDDDTDEDEEEDDMEQTDKSQNPAGRQRLSAEGLEKALNAMSEYAQQADVGERRKELMRRAQSKAGLSKSEARELFVNLGGGEGKSSLRQRVAQAFDGEGQMAKSASAAAEAQDAFAYLEGLNGNVSKSFGVLADAVEQSDHRAHGTQLLLCKALARIGAAVKSVSDRIDAIGQAPARAPKSISAGAQAVSKSFAGAPSQQSLTREDAVDALTRMNKATIGTSRPGLSKGNRDLVQAIDVLSTSGQIDPGLLAEITQFKATGRFDG